MYLNLLAYFSLSVWHILLSSLNIQRYDSVLKILKILILLWSLLFLIKILIFIWSLCGTWTLISLT